MRAVNSAGDGPWLATGSVVLDGDGETPVLESVEPGNGKIRLRWAHDGPTPDNGGYWGYRSGDAGTGTDTTIPSAQAGTTARSYVVSGLTNGNTYTFAVYSWGRPIADQQADRVALYSNTRTVTLPAAPAKPAGLTATPTSAGASLSWTDPNNDDITGWQYQQKLSSQTWGSGHQWTRVPSSNAGTTSVSVSGLTNGTAYTFRVRAVIEYEQALGGDLASTASDDVAVTPVGVVVSKDRLALTEGAAVSTYTVALSHAPTADVTITVLVDSDGTVTADTNDNLTGNQTTLTFHLDRLQREDGEGDGGRGRRRAPQHGDHHAHRHQQRRALRQPHRHPGADGGGDRQRFPRHHAVGVERVGNGRFDGDVHGAAGREADQQRDGDDRPQQRRRTPT